MSADNSPGDDLSSPGDHSLFPRKKAHSLPTLCILGLGNPGDEYRNTRHNAGFWLIDRIVEKESLRLRSPFFGSYQYAMFDGEGSRFRRIILVKPQTFMNRSGQVIPHLLRKFGKPMRFLVAVDNMDLEPGLLRLKTRGGTAGHNGLKSISQHLDSEFWPLYIGVGHPGRREDVIPYVLGEPGEDETERYDGALSRAVSLIPRLAREPVEKLLSEINSRSGTGA